jgi:hypothetical protein
MNVNEYCRVVIMRNSTETYAGKSTPGHSFYNEEHLHSALSDMTPMEFLRSRVEARSLPFTPRGSAGRRNFGWTNKVMWL